jgi:competence protein ComEC
VSLIYLSCTWVAGIFLGSKFNLPATFLLTALIPLPVLFLLRQHRKQVILASLCLIVFFGGTLRFQSSLPVTDESSLQFYNDHGTIEIKGLVDRDPDVRDKTTHIRLSATHIQLNDQWQDVSGTALLFVPRYPAYNYGYVLLVTGKLETPAQLDDFDYRDYLSHQGIYSTMLYPAIQVLDTGAGSKPLQWIYSVRNRLSQTLAKVLPEPQASLAQGMILGIRSNIPQELTTDFARSGTAHLLAISGLHLSIVAGILLSIGIWLFGRRHYIYIWLALGAIWLYALLTGMNPPIIRAAIMVSLFLTAELLGRQRSAITSLAFAAAIMVGINPQILWTASFQMSFAAMAGLIFIFPPIQSLGRKAISARLSEGGVAASTANFVVDSISVTLGAILAVWPLVAYYFGIFSLVAPLATLLALPALPLIIVTGSLAAVIGLVFLPIAQAIGWLAWLFTSYMLAVVNGFAALPLSSVEVGSASPALIWVYYLVLASALWLNGNRKRWTSLVPRATDRLRSGIDRSSSFATRLPKKWVIPPLVITAILTSLAAAAMPDDNLHVSFLDVGDGDAILIQKGNQHVLVDGGPGSQAITLELGKRLPFWDRTIDLVVLTHPHSDHLAGLIEVLNRYQVRQVLYPTLDDASPLVNEWLTIIQQKKIKHTIACAGQRIDLGGEEVVIEVLNPPTPLMMDTGSDTDNNGVVLQITAGEVSFLLTADIMYEAELELITRRADLTSTVLKVGHHGSDTSTSQQFLAVVNPQVAVISVGADNKFGHPSDEVIDKLVQKLGSENIYRTDERGTIEFTTNGSRLWVRSDR